MSINLESHLGIHAAAVAMRGKRAEVLAANLANSETPGYKARDVSFDNMFQALQSKNLPASQMAATNRRHFSSQRTTNEMKLMYRVPTQTSLDGNTVQTDIENSLFTENAIRYQASLHFLKRKFSGLIKVLRSE